MIYGADKQSDISLSQANFSKKSVIIMGAEGHGIRTGLKNLCDQIISIDMSPTIESLNVSVASGIILNQYFMQHQK